MRLLQIRSSKRPRDARLSVARCVAAGTLAALAVASPLSAQRPPTIRDRAQQDAARKPGSAGIGVIDGVVTDTLLRPLSSADVSVVGVGARVVTEEGGRFRFLQVPAGQYLLVVRRIGFAPTSGIIEVPANDTLRLSYILARTTNLLDTIRVKETRISMRMMEFEQRRAQGIGQFITQEQIERRGSMQTADYLRTLSGVDVSTLTSTQFQGKIALSKREAGSVLGEGAGACAMQIILDGIVMPRNFNLDLLPPPKQIAGIELYKGSATVPPQFGGADRRCGMIIFWTREGY